MDRRPARAVAWHRLAALRAEQELQRARAAAPRVVAAARAHRVVQWRPAASVAAVGEARVADDGGAAGPDGFEAAAEMEPPRSIFA